MARIMPAFLALAAAAAAMPAGAADRRYSVSDFDRVIVEGPYAVRLVVGPPSSATATGTREALDRLSVDVQGQTLRIRRSRSGWGGTPGADAGPVTITLATRTLRSARLIGPASLEVDGARGLNVAVLGRGQRPAARHQRRRRHARARAARLGRARDRRHRRGAARRLPGHRQCRGRAPRRRQRHRHHQHGRHRRAHRQRAGDGHRQRPRRGHHPRPRRSARSPGPAPIRCAAPAQISASTASFPARSGGSASRSSPPSPRSGGASAAAR